MVHFFYIADHPKHISLPGACHDKSPYYNHHVAWESRELCSSAFEEPCRMWHGCKRNVSIGRQKAPKYKLQKKTTTPETSNRFLPIILPSTIMENKATHDGTHTWQQVGLYNLGKGETRLSPPPRKRRKASQPQCKPRFGCSSTPDSWPSL